ncbi:MAG: hypothetical protein JO132_04085 [Streptosporangiaceae bacterium]|nr:hypothetical protein [Streptosporangiaceae bacterium]
MASKYPHEGQETGDGGEAAAELRFRSPGASRPAHGEARAELRDRETYYEQLRFAVHCQSRSVPVPRAAPGGDTWT